MSFITPEDGWENQPQDPSAVHPALQPRPPVHLAPPPQQPYPPQYPQQPYYPPPQYQHGNPSFVNDIRNMGGREIRQAAYGATFGVTSGFLMARFLMSLFKFAVVIGIIVLFVMAVRLFNRGATPAASEDNATSVSMAAARHRQERQFLSNCAAAAKQSTGYTISSQQANAYCSCALRVLRQTQSMPDAENTCAREVFGVSAPQTTLPEMPSLPSEDLQSAPQ